MPLLRPLFPSFLISLYLLGLGAGLTQAQSVANFVSMPPCRVIETRDPSYGAFGPPFLAAKSSRDFAIPASSCGVPSGALAYSFNITVIPHGSLPYLTMWPTGQQQPGVSTLNSYGGAVLANAAIVPAGTNGAISVYVAGDTDLIVDINGYFVAYVAPTIPTVPTIQQIQAALAIPTIQQVQAALAMSSTGLQSTALGAGASSLGTQNTAVGSSALVSNTAPTPNTGNSNTAFGASALAANSTGNSNVGIGAQALTQSASGSSNTAVGTQTLFNSGTANNNTAVGSQALWSHNSGDYNIAIGSQAMYDDVGGQNNVAIGRSALSNNQYGNNNIAIGTNAGNLVTGYSNIDIGHSGAAGESNTIRIGTAGQQQFTYIAGIHSTGVSSASGVYIDSTGKLGTIQSSRRYKEDIQDMGTASDALMQLRPVQFRYKQASPDGSKPLQFGLIAEEVAQVYPELAVRNKEGQIESVQYQQLPAMLLNELQKQHQIIERQEQEIQALESRLAALENTGSHLR